MKKGQIDCVITISGDGERANTGIVSYLRFLQDRPEICTKTLHLVKPGLLVEEELGKTTLQALRDNEVTIVPHAHFDPSLVSTEARAVIFIGPDLQVTKVGMDRLVELLDTHHKSYSEFAVTSILKFDERHDDWRNPWNYVHASAYGMLIVLMMVDIWRSLVNMTKYHRTVDLRAQTLNVTYPQRAELRRGRWWMWWLWTGVCGTEDGGLDVVQVIDYDPKRTPVGWSLVFRTLSQHRGFGLPALIWPICFAIYYFIASWPWWNLLFASSNAQAYHGYWQVVHTIFYRDLWKPIWIGFYLVQLIPVLVCSWLYMDFPLRTTSTHVLCYGLWVALFPLALLYARFLRLSRHNWKRFKNMVG